MELFGFIDSLGVLGEERRDLRLLHDGGVQGGDGGVRVEQRGRDAVEDPVLDVVQAVSDHDVRHRKLCDVISYMYPVCMYVCLLARRRRACEMRQMKEKKKHQKRGTKTPPVGKGEKGGGGGRGTRQVFVGRFVDNSHHRR